MRDGACSLCGASHDRDVNSARNILKLGLSAQPPVEGIRKKTLTSPKRKSRI